jgi:divalent metal cation (Fe/Co/Zn/Cd) transporter
MTLEAALALAAAWRAHSPALIAFGGDSLIELASAATVLRRFRLQTEASERHAARITGILLFALAAYVVIASMLSLFGYNEPEPSVLGIFVLTAAAIFMPLLAREKRRLSAASGSAALRADAAESALCAYLSLIALAGIALNTVWHVQWADPLAALIIVPLVLREGMETMRGKPCHCVD